MRSLDIYQSRGRIRVTGLGAGTHDVLDTLVNKFSRHDHTIGFAVIGNQLEYTASTNFEVFYALRAILTISLVL